MDAEQIYKREILKLPLLTHEQVKTFAKLKDMGSLAARNKLINHNQRLVVNLAGRVVIFCKSLDFMDLVQAGNLGLLRAVKKFNWRLGYRFSTYATWWIRQSIYREIIDRDGCIRLPVHVAQTVKRKLKENPKHEDSLALEMLNDPVFIDHSGEDDTPWDFPYDPEYVEKLSYEKLVASLNKVLTDIAGDDEKKMRNIDMFRTRTGLETGEKVTLQVTGQKFGITRERVRQICFEVERELAEAL